MSEITDKEYRELKREVEQAQGAAQRARGALDQTIQTLKEDFGCENLGDAKEKLKQLERKRDKAEKAFVESMVTYKEDWKDGSESRSEGD